MLHNVSIAARASEASVAASRKIAMAASYTSASPLAWARVPKALQRPAPPPRTETVGLAESRQVHPGSQERLLHHIGSQIHVRQDGDGRGVGAALVAPRKATIGVFVAGQGLLHQQGIGHVGHQGGSSQLGRFGGSSVKYVPITTGKLTRVFTKTTSIVQDRRGGGLGGNEYSSTKASGPSVPASPRGPGERSHTRPAPPEAIQGGCVLRSVADSRSAGRARNPTTD